MIQERAHPRSRGENQGDRIFDRSNNGSSPLTRGKPERRRRRQQRDRLIPAHAGKTCVRLSISLRNRAHPRSRGENGRVRHRHVKGRGSSPLTRGKLLAVQAWAPTEGLIPAHAGKTPRLQSRRHLINWLIPAHAGKTPSKVVADIAACGSSPLTRGKRSRPAQPHTPRRLIPAHAGKTGSRSTERSARRLIPAHAGKTTSRSTATSMGTAHPRSRGENRRCRREPVKERGSSPLTRGKHGPLGPSRWFIGLIPAHAGKTQRCQAVVNLIGAHPRSRGENDAGYQPEQVAEGSSPLTRGKRLSAWPGGR